MTTALEMGQNIALHLDGEPVQTIRLSVGWNAATETDLDLSALLLGPGARVRSDADFIFYNQPEDTDGSVRLLGRAADEARGSDRLMVDTASLAEDVEKVVVLVSLDPDARVTLGSVDELALVLSSADEQPLASFAVPALKAETALILGELYRRDQAWRFRAVGQGYDSGLAGVAADFGITVDSDAEPDEPDEAAAGSAGAAEQVAPELDQAVTALPLSPAVATRTSRRSSVRTKKRTQPVSTVRALTLGEDDSWKAARMFPVVGIGGADEQERRATSALLSVLMGVKEFGRGITGRLGAPVGLLETYLEVQFPLGEATVIPDGVLRVARGSRVWTALVEVKTGSNPLLRPQIESYLAVARERGYDAVVTISNELPSTAGEHPVGVDRRKLRKVALHHLAWAEIVHEATMQLSHRGVADPTQAWVLSELVRYLQHPRSGASGFEEMGSSWVTVRDAVIAGTLRPSDRKAPQVTSSWDRLIRQVCLRKTGELGTDVTPVGARTHAADPAARTAALVKALVSDGQLAAALRIPGTAGPMRITADLRTAQIELSVDVTAPEEGRPLTRINWLLRQLGEAPDKLRIDALTSRSSDNRCELLDVARQDPKLLLPQDNNPRTYRLTLALPPGYQARRRPRRFHHVRPPSHRHLLPRRHAEPAALDPVPAQAPRP